MVSEWPMEPFVSLQDRTGTREKVNRKVSLSSCTAGRLEDRVRETLNALKIRVRGERLKYVKSQLEKNNHNLQHHLREVERLARVRDNHHHASSAGGSVDADGIFSGETAGLITRSRLALFSWNSRQPHDKFDIQTPQICSRLNFGNSDARKVVFIDNATLEAVSRLPLYTAWMFVDRNERMTKDQSIARRRRISYDLNSKETFFCLDEEEEAIGEEEMVKDIRALSESEEFISRMAVLEHGVDRTVLDTIAGFLQVSVAKVESLFKSLPTAEFGNSNTNCGWQPATMQSVSQHFQSSIYNNPGCHIPIGGNLQEDNDHDVRKVIPESPQKRNVEPNNEEEGEEETKMSTTLALALDSFDTLFCRRCLVFNCALHACLEEIVVGVNEIQPQCTMVDRDQLNKPCSPECRFLQSSTLSQPFAATTPTMLIRSSASDFQRSSHMSCATEMKRGYIPGERIIGEDHLLNGQLRARVVDRIQELDDDDDSEEVLLNFAECPALEIAAREGRLNSHEKKNMLPVSGENHVKAKNVKTVSDIYSTLDEKIVPVRRPVEDAESSSDSMVYKYERKLPNIPPPLDGNVFKSTRSTNAGSTATTRGQKRVETSANGMDEVVQLEEPPAKPPNKWNRLEQDLCEKGIQIFGKNSCLIAQNVLKGCKSCQQIYDYIIKQDIVAAAVSGDESSSARVLSTRGNDMRSVELHAGGGRVFRPKFRFGRKKIAPKFSLGPIRKRIGRDGSGVLNLCRQYTPCSCESKLGCGKECPCVLMNMHCEKYCGCFKVCKNRFRGCQCAKSMCDRRNCPCFAAGRECDPDVCKFCWINCGQSSSQECHNMRILQRKKKRLLLAQSDVCTGWGVFTRHPLHKNDYIGEYTGELISHSEADRRGRVYDRETSFLFNLNDKLVVDAFRKGNKLKFANHSSRKPNCYAKVVLVGGDHRVGIFAKDKIEAGDELLYDYQYEPEIAPLWATGPG